MDGSGVFRGWLRRRRQERGLTQEELGELAGYAGQTVRKVEGGQRRPSFQLAARLADALALPADERPAWMAAARASGAEADDGPSERDDGAGGPSADEREAPSLASAPSYLTPFVGRERELAELGAMLRDEGCRLITLLGPGGVGKTRLAAEAARCGAGFRDGAAFVALASAARPAEILPAVAGALGLVASGGDQAAQLLGHLRGRELLLVLDNMEHLLGDGEAPALLERVLARAPGVTVLATSRERLRVPGEWVLEVEGLPVPPAGAPRGGSPAVALFAEHARRAQRGFRLTPQNEAEVAHICRLVEGLPLGIELAATWVRVLGLAEIGGELRRGLDTRHLSPGALPERHRSLRAVVDHSWRLLSEEERGAMRGLSVFHGGFTREAALRVAGAGLDVLASLADKSLVRRAAGGRYDVHEIIRQHADWHLRQDGAAFEEARDRHAAYYLELLAAREPAIKGAGQAAAAAELGAELDNLRAAWRRAAARGRCGELAAAAEALQWLCEFRSWYRDGAALFLEAAGQLRGLPPSPGRDLALGAALAGQGYLGARLGEFGRAAGAAAEAVSLLEPAGGAPLARALAHLGIARHGLGDYAAARAALGRGLALAEAAGDRWAAALCLTWEGIVAGGQGQLAEAERLFRSALAGWRAQASPRATLWCATACSPTLLALGRHDEAAALLRESLMLGHTTGDRFGMAMALQRLGLIAADQGDVAEAVYLLREALALLRAVGSSEVAQALSDLAGALRAAGSPAEAERAYLEALGAALAGEAAPDALRALAGLAALLGGRGRHAEALGLASRAIEDPACGAEARREAEAAAAQARAAIPPALAAETCARASRRPLAEIHAELAAK